MDEHTHTHSLIHTHTHTLTDTHTNEGEVERKQTRRQDYPNAPPSGPANHKPK